MKGTDRPTRSTSTLATVDRTSSASSASVWIHQIPYPLIRTRYAELGLVRGRRLASVRGIGDRVRVELPDGEVVTVPLDHAHCIEVFQVLDGVADVPERHDPEPVGIGRSGENSVYWIGTDPASLAPLGDESRIGSDRSDWSRSGG